jgi:hypothetical protein
VVGSLSKPPSGAYWAGTCFARKGATVLGASLAVDAEVMTLYRSESPCSCSCSRSWPWVLGRVIGACSPLELDRSLFRGDSSQSWWLCACEVAKVDISRFPGVQRHSQEVVQGRKWENMADNREARASKRWVYTGYIGCEKGREASICRVGSGWCNGGRICQHAPGTIDESTVARVVRGVDGGSEGQKRRSCGA